MNTIMLWWLTTPNPLMLATNVSVLFLLYFKNHRLFRYSPGVFFSWRLGWRRISIWYILLAEGGKKKEKTKNTRQSMKICDIFKKALLLSSIFYAFPNAIDPMLYKSTNIIKGTVYPSQKRHWLSCGAELK